jgi:hypothetical protein
MDWRKASEGGEQGVRVPFNWLYLHYYEGLTALFRVENALRMFVFMVLKDERKGKWADLQITSDDGGDTTVSAVARRRISQDERFGYLGYAISSPLMHLTSGELIRLIFADPYWPWFAKYFPASKDIVRTKLEEIGNIRNALAHFRPIKSDDVEVVKQNANQVMSRVEQALHNLGSSSRQNVPSNTSDNWYGALKAVAGQYVTLGFQQSENENWINVRLTYACPQLAKPGFYTDDYRIWRLLTLDSVAVLKSCPVILDNVIFMVEVFPPAPSSGETSGIRKGVDFVFSRATLTSAHDGVRQDLEKVILQITRETDLILEDNLAKGDLVRIGTAPSSKANERWRPDVSKLRTPLRQEDPPEYWGQRPAGGKDLVTDAQSYPWMPVPVSSEDDGPPF